jgi:glycosyltransferase involved in cell wall biosynthesis
LPFSGLDRVFDVAFFARVTPEKGVFDFLRVVANLVRWRRSIRALVMGFASDEMAIKVREMASELGIAGNVEFRFNAPRNEAMRLLAQSKLAIYPTRLDTFPLSVLETLSCGTPVIAYAIPAIRLNYADTRAVIKTKPLDIEEMTRRQSRHWRARHGGSWAGNRGIHKEVHVGKRSKNRMEYTTINNAIMNNCIDYSLTQCVIPCLLLPLISHL